MNNTLLVKTADFASISELFGLNPGFHLIAGPCAIESGEQLEKVAQKLVHNGVKFIRGGAFKPRTSPYEFQGLGMEGLKILNYMSKKYSLLSVSEITDARNVEKAVGLIDIIQIGSRNMQNTDLLKEAGGSKHPVLLKRGIMSKVEEFLLAAEYIALAGNKKIILCERGIRTFEDSTRNTLDISGVAIIKKETSLPVIVDLSHSLGRKDILLPVAKAVAALGADGIMLEVHDNPAEALSDSKQQLSLEEFQDFYDGLPQLSSNRDTISTALG